MLLLLSANFANSFHVSLAKFPSSEFVGFYLLTLPSDFQAAFAITILEHEDDSLRKEDE